MTAVFPELGEADEAIYAARLAYAMGARLLPAPPPTTCPECGESLHSSDDQDGWRDAHIFLAIEVPTMVNVEGKIFAFVLVGCEGYWTVDPNLVGIPRDDWEPQSAWLPLREEHPGWQGRWRE